MNLRLRSIDSAGEAKDLLPVLTRAVHETWRTLREEADEEESARHAENFLERHAGGELGLLLVGEDEAGTTLAMAACSPFVDPLTGETHPMIVVLWVDPSIRHRGVARALVQELRRISTKRGHPVLTARAGVGDDAILSMGERWGLVRAWEFLSTE